MIESTKHKIEKKLKYLTDFLDIFILCFIYVYFELHNNPFKNRIVTTYQIGSKIITTVR